MPMAGFKMLQLRRQLSCSSLLKNIPKPSPLVGSAAVTSAPVISEYRLHGACLAQETRHRAASKGILSLFSRTNAVRNSSRDIYASLDTLNDDILTYIYGPSCQLPFTFQSWFSVTQLHLWMCQTKIRSFAAEDRGKALNGALVDRFSADIELKLRLNNITNSRMYDRYLQQLMSFHYAAVIAYDEGFDSDDAILASSLWRNMFLMSEQVRPEQIYNMTLYCRHQMAYLHDMPEADFLQGETKIRWACPPEELVIQIAQ